MMSSTPPPRFDPLLLVHKAVRQVLFEVTLQIGTVDASDIFAVDRCAREVGRLIALLPEATAALVPLCDALYQRDAAARQAAARALYREATAVVSTELVRQQHAEATSTPELHARLTDDELRAIRREQLAAMSESDLADAIGPLAAASTPHEFAAFLDDLQASVAVQTFDCLTDSVRRRLEASRWARIVRERGDPDDLADGPIRSAAGAGRDDAAGSGLHRRSHRAERNRLLAQ